LHVRTVGDLPLPQAHALTEELEARLRFAEPELERVTIHLERA
jgi:divalent metal cation (Fe/Co/Zn/Cd) transporter